ncbi:ATP-binding cassette domain-containing protein, partial [Staphylococcus hominis]|uniref:ATP-binding cassette domain-containing protein n=1 Tax=Staphylococcus hominis TaxID=1290 RepID=UPI003709AD14
MDFSLHKPQFLPIIPPSPSPKTTLLNLITSIHTISHPTLQITPNHINHFSNKKLPQFPNKQLPFIFQHYSLLPTLTLKQNVI